MNKYEILNSFVSQNLGDGLITFVTLIALGVLFISTSSIVLYRVIILAFIGLIISNQYFFEISEIAIVNSTILFIIFSIGFGFGVYDNNGKTNARYIKDIRDYMFLITLVAACCFFASLNFNSFSTFFLSLNLVAFAFALFFGFVAYLTNLKLQLIVLKDKENEIKEELKKIKEH